MSIKSLHGDNCVPFRGWGNFEAAAIYAGVSKRTISDWVNDGLPCAERNSKTKLIKFSDIDNYLENYKRKETSSMDKDTTCMDEADQLLKAVI